MNVVCGDVSKIMISAPDHELKYTLASLSIP